MMLDICGDCAVQEGQLHEHGCDKEICPVCKGQRICCDCDVKEEQREPFFSKIYPCMRCGVPYDCTMVSNELWAKICGVTYDKTDVLCERCIKEIMRLRGLSNVNPSCSLIGEDKK